MSMSKALSGAALAAALTLGAAGVMASPATAADGSGAQSSARTADRDFNPTVQKVNAQEILVKASQINRSNTLKLMVDKGGTWRTLKVWNPTNARDKNFAEVVDVGFVGKNVKNRYILRVVDHNRNGRVIQVQDSNDDRKRGNAGGNNNGGNTGGDNETPEDGGLIPGLPF